MTSPVPTPEEIVQQTWDQLPPNWTEEQRIREIARVFYSGDIERATAAITGLQQNPTSSSPSSPTPNSSASATGGDAPPFAGGAGLGGGLQDPLDPNFDWTGGPQTNQDWIDNTLEGARFSQSGSQGGRQQLFNSYLALNPGLDAVTPFAQDYLQDQFFPASAQYALDLLGNPTAGVEDIPNFFDYLGENDWGAPLQPEDYSGRLRDYAGRGILPQAGQSLADWQNASVDGGVNPLDVQNRLSILQDDGLWSNLLYNSARSKAHPALWNYADQSVGRSLARFRGRNPIDPIGVEWANRGFGDWWGGGGAQSSPVSSQQTGGMPEFPGAPRRGGTDDIFSTQGIPGVPQRTPRPGSGLSWGDDRIDNAYHGGGMPPGAGVFGQLPGAGQRPVMPGPSAFPYETADMFGQPPQRGGRRRLRMPE